MNQLLPCPFCGKPAESDHQRHFVNYKGVRGTAVAIYCSQCSADMTLCYFPEYSPEELMSMLIEQWNRRARLGVCFACKQPLKDQAYQAETGNWVATGKFPTLDFCSAKCGKDFNRLHPLRA